jgi:hypothetical protein
MSYQFEYDGPSARPRWVKVITDSDGAEQRVVLNFKNEEERESLTDENVYFHLDNLIQYIKDVSQGISAIGLEDMPAADGWHFNGGWGEIEWAKQEVLVWWESVYYKNEPNEEEPA